MQEKTTALLLVEDDEKLADMICDWFEEKSFTVTVCHDGTGGLREARRRKFDVMILDIMLPGMDGFSLLETLRKEGNSIPVLCLTAMGDLSDRLKGFAAGAQDYLTKPFAMQELEARVRVLSGKNVLQEKEKRKDLVCGDLRLDPKSRELLSNGKTVRLAGREYDLMAYFMENQGWILSKEQISEAVWKMESDVQYNQEEVYISFLRRKLRYLGSGTQIVTKRGAGYVLQAGEDEKEE